MSTFYLPLTITLRERLLLPVGGSPVSPRSADHISGPVVRGMLAGLCRGDTAALQDLVLSGALEAAPALPWVVDAGGADVATPTPRVLLAERGELEPRVFDARTPEEVPSTRMAPLTVRRGQQWHPVHVSATPELRLARPTRGSVSAGSGGGPFVMVALDPWQRFRAQLVVRADDMQEATRLREVLAVCIEAAPVVELGGAAAAYGGDLYLQLGELSDQAPTPRLAPGAGSELDLVLRAPALVVNPDTGDSDPAALGDAVNRLWESVVGAGSVEVVSVSAGRHLLGGAHAGYGRSRPEHWAASAGSVTRVRVRTEVTAGQWQQLLGTRLGERTVDGLGVWEPEEPVTAASTVGAVLRCTVPVGQHELRLGDGSTIPAAPPPVGADPDPEVADLDPEVAALQARLFTQATTDWIRVVAPTVATGLDTPPVTVSAHLLGRLREALEDPAQLEVFATELGEDTSPTRRSVDDLPGAGGHTTMSGWLSALSAGTSTVATTMTPRWVDHLTAVELHPGAGVSYPATGGADLLEVERRLALAVVAALRTRVVTR